MSAIPWVDCRREELAESSSASVYRFTERYEDLGESTHLPAAPTVMFDYSMNDLVTGLPGRDGVVQPGGARIEYHTKKN